MRQVCDPNSVKTEGFHLDPCTFYPRQNFPHTTQDPRERKRHLPCLPSFLWNCAAAAAGHALLISSWKMGISREARSDCRRPGQTTQAGTGRICHVWVFPQLRCLRRNTLKVITGNVLCYYLFYNSLSVGFFFPDPNKSVNPSPSIERLQSSVHFVLFSSAYSLFH